VIYLVGLSEKGVHRYIYNKKITMKHLLNDLSSEEKNRIREQYEGGMAVDVSKFKKLVETKLGDAKPLVMEQMVPNNGDQELLNKACTTWASYKKTSSPEEIESAKEWSKKFTMGAPYDLDVICGKSKAIDAVKSDNDRKVLQGYINLDWLK
jgi:hypothetical protein